MVRKKKRDTEKHQGKKISWNKYILFGYTSYFWRNTEMQLLIVQLINCTFIKYIEFSWNSGATVFFLLLSVFLFFSRKYYKCLHIINIHVNFLRCIFITICSILPKPLINHRSSYITFMEEGKKTEIGK